MIRKKNNRLERDKLIDGFFNKGWCCDLDEVKNAVFDTIQELEEANDINATRVIELTQKINKAIDYIKSHCEIIRYENYDKIGNVDGAILLKILDGTNKILGDKE